MATDLTTEQVKNNNPKGIGGFRDNPQNRNDGGRYPRSESFTYWYNYFKEMSIVEFKRWKDSVSDETKTVASDLAYTRIENAKYNLREFQEIADRTEGKARQIIKHSEDIVTSIKVEIVESKYI